MPNYLTTAYVQCTFSFTLKFMLIILSLRYLVKQKLGWIDSRCDTYRLINLIIWKWWTVYTIVRFLMYKMNLLRLEWMNMIQFQKRKLFLNLLTRFLILKQLGRLKEQPNEFFPWYFYLIDFRNGQESRDHEWFRICH